MNKLLSTELTCMCCIMHMHVCYLYKCLHPSSLTYFMTDMFNSPCLPGQLASLNEAKEEKEQVVITTKVETVKEETVKQKESVAKELPTQSSPVKEAPPPPTTGKQEVLKVFAALIVFLFFALLLLSFVRGVGDVHVKN